MAGKTLARKNFGVNIWRFFRAKVSPFRVCSSYAFPMIPLCFSYAFPTPSLRFCYAFPMASAGSGSEIVFVLQAARGNKSRDPRKSGRLGIPAPKSVPATYFFRDVFGFRSLTLLSTRYEGVRTLGNCAARIGFPQLVFPETYFREHPVSHSIPRLTYYEHTQ